MPTRRAFLGSSLAALSSAVPPFVARSAAGASAGKDSRVLVLVELDGGNDALNTVVPHRDEDYARLRPTLKLNPKRLVPLTDALGLHPALRPLDALLQAGRLAVVPGVGYPGPDRSHTESMAVWHTASPDPGGRRGHGWLGRALDPAAGTLFSVGGGVPQALRGRRSTAVAFDRPDDGVLADPRAARLGVGPEPAGDLLAFARRRTLDAHAAAGTLAALGADPGGQGYPPTALGGRLRLAARLLKAGAGARVFYARQAGYDTHARQHDAHFDLLAEFAGAVGAFFADLAAAKLADRVTLLAFSEFGRTLRENGSGGTDHGTAGAVLVAGPTVKGGVVGTMPNLADLEHGEPRMTADFRGVYAAVLADWLGLPAPDTAAGVARPALFAG